MLALMFLLSETIKKIRNTEELHRLQMWLNMRVNKEFCLLSLLSNPFFNISNHVINSKSHLLSTFMLCFLLCLNFPLNDHSDLNTFAIFL